MMKKVSQFILGFFGWKPYALPEEPDKSIICVAPHTSNWDFIIGKLFYWALGRKTGFLMKKSWFFFPMGYLMRAMGGVPIDRSKRTSVTQQMIKEFDSRKKFHLAITPEGTRSMNNRWKLGFYHIAVGAGVPIQLAVIHYQKKEMGIKEIFYPTGNEKEDLKYIYDFYRKNAGPKSDDKFAVPEIK
ncbi:MAG TPA: lysophospholipid acyltransferase family protein [Paludibacteraceae bacterium]|nr:lysophospholipid acyltransferase family protein [Prolixibacteraceae bacterium]HPT43987.1 lysophospholipid acyltransferase family protein [Paludibacteraceae bacterium]